MTVERLLIGVALLAGLAAGYLIARSRRRGRRSERPQPVHQILLPFTGTEISRRAVDAALRLARAEEATLMPAYLAARQSPAPGEDQEDPDRGGRAMRPQLGPLAGSGGLTTRFDHQPEAAELRDVVAEDRAGGVVDVVVERVAGIGHLELPVGPLGRPQHLIRNAIRHTPADGSVTVRAEAGGDAIESVDSNTIGLLVGT